MRKIFIVSLLFSSTVATAQKNAYTAAADEYFEKGDYYSAATYYEKSLTSGGSKSAGGFNPYSVQPASAKMTALKGRPKNETNYRLAESYRLLHFYSKAEPYYKEVIAAAPAQFPAAQYHLGVTLRALGKFDEAATAFAAYLTTAGRDEKLATEAQRELNNISFIKTQMAKPGADRYTIAKASVNDNGGNYAAVRSGPSDILFTSTREMNGKERTNDIYRATVSNGSFGPVTKEKLSRSNNMHQGITALSADGSVMYFTRWEIDGVNKSSSIYRSRKSDEGWSAPEAITTINGGNARQPMLMPDGGMLIFSSERSGGFGGFDLWSAAIDGSGNISAPVNMGSAINTAYDEQSPSFHSPTSTFIFSSNGRTGLGGYDFFYSKKTAAGFSEPRNFGFPVNSVKDDLYFIGGPTKNMLEDAMFSSDRDAACCLEIFTLSKQREPRIVSGKVIACDTRAALENAKLEVRDAGNNIVTTLTTNASGEYQFTQEEFRPLKATATASGYFTNSISFNAPADEASVTLLNDALCLTVIPAAPIRVENVYYDYNKATLKEESFPALDSLIEMLNDNPTMSIELGAHTDSRGTDEYNIKLSEARAKSVVDYLISKGISGGRLISKGYGETQPVAENENADGTDNPDGRQLNRRTEFRVLKN